MIDKIYVYQVCIVIADVFAHLAENRCKTNTLGYFTDLGHPLIGCLFFRRWIMLLLFLGDMPERMVIHISPSYRSNSKQPEKVML